MDLESIPLGQGFKHNEFSLMGIKFQFAGGHIGIKF